MGEDGRERGLFPADLFLVEGATRDEVSAWARDRITTALIKEAAVEERVAREIAAAVEQRIFTQSERRVSTSLIRELVNQELLSRGFDASLRKQLVVGLPKYDLERHFRPERTAGDPEMLCRTIGETTVRQYALQEIYPRDVADAHLEGRIHIHDLEYPQRRFWQVGAIDGAPGAARALTTELAHRGRELRRTATTVEWPRLNRLYASTSGALDEAAFAARDLAPSRLGLEWGEEQADRVAVRMLQAWDGCPAMFVLSQGPPPPEEAWRFVAEAGRSLFVLGRGDAPSASRYGSTLAGAVTVNVAQAFYRSEAGTDFYAELDVAIAAAAQAHARKGRLLPAGAGPYAIGIAGLDEAVRLLTGRAPAEDEGALRLALRVVSYLYYRVREEAQRHQIALGIHDVTGAAAAGRLARIDGRMFASARGHAAQFGAEYSVGIRLRASAGTDPFEWVARQARFHALLPTSPAALPMPLRRALGPRGLQELLARVRAETPATQVWVA